MRMSRTIAVLAGLSLAVVACGGDSPAEGPPTGGTPNPPPATAQVGMVSGADPYGDESHSFTPPTVTIQRSGTVTWSNNTGIIHNVTFAGQQGAPAHIPNMPSGSASRDFAAAGEFDYTCTNHAGMSGRVVVED